MSTLDAAKVFKIHVLRVPPAGGWYCDLALDGGPLPALGPATLTVGDLQLVGTVTQAGFDDHPTGGALPRVTIEGGVGWSRPLVRRGEYSSPEGVRLSTVLHDLAALAGELYDAPAVDVILPPGYGWTASTPSERVTGAVVLADLVARGAIPTWRVASSGRTRFDAWPSTGAADAAGRVLRRNLNRGRRTVGLDARVAAFLPGCTLEGVVVDRLHLTETARKLEAEAYGTFPGPLEHWRAITAQLFPWTAGIRLSAISGGLRVLAAATKALHLQGDAGDPAAARVGDLVVRLYRDGNSGILWASTSTAPPYAWAPVAFGVVPPTIADAGSALVITTGSQKVTVA